MVDNIYKNAFKQVYDILENTDENLVEKIPPNIIKLIKDNMNLNYNSNIQKNLEISQQNILKETESILALFYRNYWITDEEKIEFAIKDKNELIENEKKKKEQFNGKNIDELFPKKNITSSSNNFILAKKENFIKSFFHKILNFFKK